MFQMIESDINQYLAKPKSKDLKALVKEDILYLYKEEFNDSIEKILINTESHFMSSFKSRAIEVLKALLPSAIWDDEYFQEIIQIAEQETFLSLYRTVYAQLQEGYNAFLLSNPKKFLNSFIPHCESNATPIHDCQNKGMFIPVKSNDKVAYVICHECKMCYYANMIIMQCDFCDCSFYSAYVSPLDKVLPPATWELYHCDIILNEQMKCIKCDDLFWLKGDELHCRKCKFLINPLEVAWRCVQCNKEFRAKAKMYNPLKHLIIKKAIKKALIDKERVIPRQLACDCAKNILDVDFVHSDKCEGRMYLGELYGKLILVCSNCCVFSSVNKFEWYCPLCNKAFYTTDIAKVIYDIGEHNQMSQRNALVISLGKSEETEDSNKVSESKDKEKGKEKEKEKESKKEYHIVYGNENHFYRENRLLIRPEKEELFDKIEIMKRTQNVHNNNNNTTPDIKEIVEKDNEIKEQNEDISIPLSYSAFIPFQMNELVVISKDNETLSQVNYKSKDYSLLSIPYSEEANNTLKEYKAMKHLINIYGYNHEENMFHILIEIIDNTLYKEITSRASKEEKIPFKEAEIIEMINQTLEPLKNYSSSVMTVDRFILFNDSPIKWKICPFQTEDNIKQPVMFQKNQFSLHSLALVIVYSASLNANCVDECIEIITKKTDDALIKYIMASFRGKYSAFFCELLCKLLKYKSTITLKQLDQILNE